MTATVALSGCWKAPIQLNQLISPKLRLVCFVLIPWGEMIKLYDSSDYNWHTILIKDESRIDQVNSSLSFGVLLEGINWFSMCSSICQRDNVGIRGDAWDGFFFGVQHMLISWFHDMFNRITRIGWCVQHIVPHIEILNKISIFEQCLRDLLATNHAPF